MEGFSAGSYCAPTARENSLGATAGAEPCNACGNAAIQAVLPAQPAPALWGTAQGPWAASHPTSGRDTLAGRWSPTPRSHHPAGATQDSRTKISAWTKPESLITFFIKFFSSFLKCHHSSLSCLCSLKHNRPLTSAIPHNVTLMKANKWQ